MASVQAGKSDRLASRRFTRRVIGLLAIILLGCAVALVRLPRPTGWPTVQIRFAGYTNDASGARLASFSIANVSLWSVKIGSSYQLQVPNAAGWMTHTNDYLARGGCIVRAGHSEILSIPAPSGHRQWRAAFSARHDEGLLRRIATELLIEAQKLGFPTRYRRVGHRVVSDTVLE